MLRFRHPALAVFVLMTLSPALAWGQAEKAGIVTTLEGNVTARRAILSEPVALKFKDDVFFRDTITTGDQSLARVLLGGKSIVTVRERSVLTITESPGRSFINIESGKIGLAVARERLAPGESVDIRTPNAVVGVRGTVVVAEVLPAGSNIYFLRGSGECSVLDPRTGRRIGAPVTLKPFESFRVVGSIGRVEPIPPSQVGRITAGLEGKGYQHIEAANQEQVKGQVTQATATVLTALAGSSNGQAAVGTGTGTTSPVQMSDHILVPDIHTQLGVPLPPPLPLLPPPPPDGPDILITRSLTLEAGKTLRSFSGTTTRTSLSPFAVIGGTPITLASAVAALEASVNQPGFTTAQVLAAAQSFGFTTVQQLGPDNLFEVLPGASVALAGSLLKGNNSVVFTGNNVLNVAGSFASTGVGVGAVLDLDPSLYKAPGDFVFFGPGTAVSLAGSLITTADTIVATTANVLQVTAGAVTTSSTLLSFTRSDVTAMSSLLSIFRSSFTSTTLNPVIEATNSTLAFGGQSEPGAPTTFGRMLTVAASPVAPATVVLSGPLALLTGTKVTTTENLVGVFGGSVSSATGAELIRLVNSVVTLGSSTPGPEIFGRALFITGEGGPGGASTMSLNGAFLTSVDGKLSMTGGLLGVIPGAQVISSGSGDAFVSITGETHDIGTLPNSSIFFMQGRSTATTTEVVDGVPITHGTDEPIKTARTLLETSGAMINSQAGAVFDTMLFQATAPIFSATNSTLTFANDAILFSKNVKMTSLGPLIALNASTLTSKNGAIVRLDNKSLLQVTNGPVIKLENNSLLVTRDLLALSNGSILEASKGSILHIAGGSVVNISGAFATFGGTGGNQIKVTNTLCGGPCLLFSGIPIAVTGGANPELQVNVTGAALKNTGLGSIVQSSPSAAAIVVDGPSSRLTIKGQ